MSHDQRVATWWFLGTLVCIVVAFVLFVFFLFVYIHIPFLWYVDSFTLFILWLYSMFVIKRNRQKGKQNATFEKKFLQELITSLFLLFLFKLNKLSYPLSCRG